MSENEYTTKREHNEFKREVNEGFNRVNNSIESLTSGVKSSLDDMSQHLTQFMTKSMNEDRSLERAFLTKIEDRDDKKRATNVNIAGIVVGLLSLLFGAVWWGVNANEDNKRKEDEMKNIAARHEMQMYYEKRMNDTERRILILEVKRKWSKQ